MQTFGCIFRLNLFLASRSTLQQVALDRNLAHLSCCLAFGEHQFLQFEDATSQTSIILCFFFVFPSFQVCM
jgi:hypothetical protein